MKKENILIIINACTKIIDIFLGPFLIAYFIKTSADSILDLSIYKIFGDIFIIFFGFIIAYFVKKNHGLAIFIIGIILNFLYILYIIILKEEIINHLFLMSFMFGFSTLAFWHPYNLFNIYAVENKNRTVFEANKKTINYIISILVPFILGAMITTTNYQITAIIILFISFIQIICSFYLKPLPKYNKKFNLLETLEKVKEGKDAKKVLISEFFAGLCLNDCAISVIITIFIVESFKTDINLGLINSLTAIITLIFMQIYSRTSKPKHDNKIVWFSSFLLLLSAYILYLYKVPLTIIIYNIIFEIFALGLLQLIESVRLDNFNKKKIETENINEFMIIRECFLNIGRIISFLFLIIVGIFGESYLNLIFILLNIMIIFFSLVVMRLERFE